MNLKSKLAKLTKKELIELLVEIAEKNEDVEAMMEYKLSTNTDDIKESKKLIRNYINQYKRSGFIMMRDAGSALQGAEMVLDKAQSKFEAGESEVAVRMGVAVLSIVVNMLQYADDSGGDIGMVINESVTLIDEVASNVAAGEDKRLQKSVFQEIMKEAMNKRYDGWSDWRFDLLESCTAFSKDASMRQKLETNFEKLLDDISEPSSRISQFDIERIKLLQLKVLKMNKAFDEANQFIYNHLQYPEFRKKAIEDQMDKGNMESAIKLCKDGQKKDQKLPGLVSQWKKYELQTYQALGNIEKQKELLLEFVYENEFTAYKNLKTLYDAQDWLAVLEEIFTHFEENKMRDVYTNIAIEENRPDKLLYVCKRNNTYIQDFYPYLMDNYKSETANIFKKLIREKAKPAGSRKHYRSICRLIKTYKNAFGEEDFIALKEELKEKHKRRPSFLNELEKV